MNIGDKIKDLRNYKGLTQEQLAEKSGLSKNAIWNYETGRRKPNTDILKKIASGLEVSIETFFNNNSTSKLTSAEELMDKFNIDKSFTELSELSNLSISKIDNIFSPYKKGYTDDDIKTLGKALKLSNDQIDEWLVFNAKKPYENRNEVEFNYWLHCIVNYPCHTVNGVDISELKIAELKQLIKELDYRFKLKLDEISHK